MSTNPVPSWNSLVAIAAESTFGTPPAPADTTAYAALMVEQMSCNLGPFEQGMTSPKPDRAPGRGNTTAFIEHRVPPMPWQMAMSLKSRSAIDAAPREGTALYKMAGLTQTTNASTSYVLSPANTPAESSLLVSGSIRKWHGSGDACTLMETLAGAICSQLVWTGGDKELRLAASGMGVRKYTQGSLDSITLANGSTTTLGHTAAESYRLDKGYFACESEIIEIANRTDVGYGSTSSTIARGVLGSSGAAHSAKQFRPYHPTPAFAGSPIAEPTSTVTIGGVSFRVLSWEFSLNTGIALLDPETGSAYVQGTKAVRYSAGLKMSLYMLGDRVSLAGLQAQRATAGVQAVSIVQGTGTGGIFTLACPYAEFEPTTPSDAENDVAVVNVSMRLRDNSTGANMFSITLT